MGKKRHALIYFLLRLAFLNFFLCCHSIENEMCFIYLLAFFCVCIEAEFDTAVVGEEECRQCGDSIVTIFINSALFFIIIVAIVRIDEMLMKLKWMWRMSTGE